jgi:hypothetical protein
MVPRRDSDVVLIPHSNAGLYVPALTTHCRVTGYVFVDAVLPAPAGQVPMAPAEFYDYLAPKADPDGLLPTARLGYPARRVPGLRRGLRARARGRDRPRLAGQDYAGRASAHAY